MRRRTAANWLARLQSGRDPDIECKFRRWHDSNPANAAAFASVRRSYEQAGLLRHSRLASNRPARDLKAAPHRVPRCALAASVTLALLVPAALLLLSGALAPFGASEAVMLTTDVGEIRHIELSDGSTLILDTDTSVEVEVGSDHRRARLEHGRARFEIAPAAQPFVVQSGVADVTASEATLDVDRSAEGSRILILAGKVQVRAPRQEPPTGLALSAGDSALASPSGVAKSGENMKGDWTRGMLEFDGTPITSAVALANRYSNTHIVVAESLRQLRVSGAFRAGDVAGLAEALAAAFHLNLARSADGNLHLTRRDQAALEKKSGG